MLSKFYTAKHFLSSFVVVLAKLSWFECNQ